MNSTIQLLGPMQTHIRWLYRHGRTKRRRTPIRWSRGPCTSPQRWHGANCCRRSIQDEGWRQEASTLVVEHEDHIGTGWWWLEHDWIIFPYIGNNHPNWLLYFSEGLKPPTRVYMDIIWISYLSETWFFFGMSHVTKLEQGVTIQHSPAMTLGTIRAPGFSPHNMNG